MKKQTEMPFPEYRYVDTALGSFINRNNVKGMDEIILPDPPKECYVSMFRFKGDYKIHCENTGSVKGTSSLPCYGDYLWFDIDNADLEEARKSAILLITEIEAKTSIKPDQLAIFFSGSKGYHIGIPSSAIGTEPSVELPKIYKRIALEIAGDIKIDTSIYDKNRLWRLPNSVNKKSGLYKIPLKYEELVQLDTEAINKLAGGKRELPGAGLILTPPLQVLSTQLYNKVKDGMVHDKIGAPKSNPSISSISKDGWIAEALEGLDEGNRNDTFTRITGRLHQDNYKPEDIHALLEPYANSCSFPLDELKHLIWGLCGRYALTDPISSSLTIYRGKSETESEPPKILTLSEFMDVEDTEITWCVEKIFPSEGVGIIGSPAGYGKSWTLIDLAIECARGGSWLGEFVTTQGVVLYIDEESSPQMLRSRFKKIMDGKGITDQPDIHLAVGNGISLSDNDSVALLRYHINLIKPTLVIIDSLIRVHRADENSAKEMARTFAIVKDIVRDGNCLVVFADHQRKIGKFYQGGDQQLRGSTEKVAFVDTLLSLKKVSKQLVVEHSKSRFAESISDFIISIEDLLPNTTTVAYQGLAKDTKKQERLKKVTEFLNHAIPDDKWISRKDLVNQAKEINISAKILDEALKTLESTRQIIREDRKFEGRGGKSAFYKLVTSEETLVEAQA